MCPLEALIPLSVFRVTADVLPPRLARRMFGQKECKEELFQALKQLKQRVDAIESASF